MLLGVGEAFPRASFGLLDLSRDVGTFNRETWHLDTAVRYTRLPELLDRPCVLCDPKISAGNSMLHAIHLVVEQSPSKVIVCGAFAAPVGIKRILDSFGETEIVVAQIEEGIAEGVKIVPGMGDAGDLAFGTVKGNR